MVDSWYCLNWVVPERMSQVSKRSEVGNHKRRSLNTRLSSGNSANTSCRSRNAPGRMIRSHLFWYRINLKMKLTYREKNLLDYLFGGFRSTLNQYKIFECLLTAANCALLTPGFSVSSFHQFHHHTHLVPFFGFWFLVYYAATQLATPLHQRRIQVMRSNKVAQKRLIESNGTPAMNFGCEEIRKRRYTQTKNRTQHKNTVVI